MTATTASAARNACDLLDADHLAVKHLFVEYARLAHAPGAGERASLARRICDELAVHARIEEEVFYPALESALPDAADQVAEAHVEHDAIEALVARIGAMPDADAAMDEAVAELARCVEHHVKEERDTLFPKARAAASLDLAVLADRLREARQAVSAQ